ncbi:peptidase M56 [Paenibacillus polymyxa]|uniref:peptidase M56 n=1 Tax=Paenibacillus polymyxa TaxID=1406 RepID=UPI0032AF8B81
MNKLISKKSIMLIIILVIVIIVALIVYLPKNLWTAMSVESTDLSKLTINNISLKGNVANINLTSYKKNPDFNDKCTKDADYRYYENFLIAYNSKGDIIKLQTLSENGISSFAGYNLHNLNDMKNKLGNNFADQSYDSAQSLNAKVYYDKKNRIKASFVYPKNNEADQRIVWAILEKY